jgi:hypothetical protein
MSNSFILCLVSTLPGALVEYGSHLHLIRRNWDWTNDSDTAGFISADLFSISVSSSLSSKIAFSWKYILDTANGRLRRTLHRSLATLLNGLVTISQGVFGELVDCEDGLFLLQSYKPWTGKFTDGQHWTPLATGGRCCMLFTIDQGD